MKRKRENFSERRRFIAKEALFLDCILRRARPDVEKTGSFGFLPPR